MTYRHTQSSNLVIALFGSLTVVFLGLASRADGVAGALISMGAIFVAIGFILFSFNQMTVSVDEREIHLAFRWGWPQKRIDRSEVVSARVVRNKWWYGFGVRLVPEGWLYNVWGLNAVQINLNTGKTIRIGSDDAEALSEAVQPADRPLG